MIVLLWCALLAQGAPVRILIDQPLRAVEYQLDRLSNDEIVRIERSDADPKYRPVYVALLTRQGLPSAVRDEALAALVKMDKTSPAQVLFDALARVKPEDESIADKLLAMLYAQPLDALKAMREASVHVLDDATSPVVRRGAYGIIMKADGHSDSARQAAVNHGQMEEAMVAMADTRVDADVFHVLAEGVVLARVAPLRMAALRAIERLPAPLLTGPEVEPVAAVIVDMLKSASSDERTQPALADATQLAERLAATLPDARRAPIARDLRALGVRIVKISTIVEQMAFDVRWFAVEAGSTVQIAVTNADAMPHNILIGAPKSVEAIGTAAMTMTLPSDPSAMAYVPNLPAVLESTPLIKEGETGRLNFTAPKQPGEYVFLCSYPGHWARMYGVMLVVPDLAAWDAHPTVPTDPITNQPFSSSHRAIGSSDQRVISSSDHR